MTDHLTWMATHYLRCGLSVFPLAENSKRPTGSWERYQNQLASIPEAIAWQPGNLAIATGEISGVVVIDCESESDALWFASHRARGLSPGVVATPRGFHFYFQWPGQRVANAQRVTDERGAPRYDVRGDGGYVVAPPSTVSGREYRWIREFYSAADLPMFRLPWRPERSAAPAETVKHQPGLATQASTQSSERRVTDGEAYISHINAVSGQGGHSDTWRAVNRLKDSGMSEAEAYEALSRWNQTNAHPAWSEAEIMHKVKDCFSRK